MESSVLYNQYLLRQYNTYHNTLLQLDSAEIGEWSEDIHSVLGRAKGLVGVGEHSKRSALSVCDSHSDVLCDIWSRCDSLAVNHEQAVVDDETRLEQKKLRQIQFVKKYEHFMHVLRVQ